jgi:VanZ family protein
MRSPHSPLALYLAVAYALLVAYASLHPLSGWRDTGAPVLDFLTAAWPRYHTGFDLAANILAYVPLGFLIVPALQGRLGVAAALLAALAGGGLSFALETLQNFLPSRVPSNIDLACNAIGAMIGAAAGMNWGRELVDGGRLHRLRSRLVLRGHAADFGLVLLGLWLLAQLNPELLLFGTGDLRALLELPPLPYSARRFAVIEAGVAAAGTLAAGLIAWSLLREPNRWLPMALLLAALAVKAFASMLLVSAAQFAHWITPGNMAGLAAGAVALLAATSLPPLAQRMLAALALLFATALVNLAPENPYLTASLAVWQQGHFLNFNGLTKLVSSLWPFAALPYLMLPRLRTGEHG